MATEVSTSDLENALSRVPTSAWIRPGVALLGWGERLRIDPGTGADRFDRALRRIRSSGAPLAMASFTFDEHEAGSAIVVPDTLLRIDQSGMRFLIGSEFDLPPARESTGLPSGVVEDDGIEPWKRLMREALLAIRSRELEKVVLSRRLVARFEADVPIQLVLSNLTKSEPDSHTFLVDHFAGSSPELLVSLNDGTVRSVSLAGSADLGDPGASRTLDTKKVTREHALAADSVDEALAPFCSRLERSETRIATYGDIQHLSTTFEGETHPGTDIARLLSAVHPTAAVAGTPTKTALELIRELEGHNRDRYAGPVGWLNRDGDGEFAIALRCGMIDGSLATLYSGAGIVEGSDPELEYEETRIKLRPMLGALGLI